jgi:mono/diheme cytochrome c family protein
LKSQARRIFVCQGGLAAHWGAGHSNKVSIMNTRTTSALLPAALLTMLTVHGCGGKDAAAPTDAAPPEAAAPAPAEPAAGTPAPATPVATTAAADTGAGAKVFKNFCESCHGREGKGDGAAAAALNPKPANFAVGAFKYDTNGNGTKGDVDDIRAIVRDGAAKHGGSPLMAPWPMLSPSDLDAVAAYVKSLHAS